MDEDIEFLFGFVIVMMIAVAFILLISLPDNDLDVPACKTRTVTSRIVVTDETGRQHERIVEVTRPC
jgi:hypothetical protein